MRTVLVLALALASCYRDSAPVAPPANHPVPRRVPSAARDVLAYLPAEATFVMTVDFARVRDSVLWSHATELIANKLGAARPGTEGCMDLVKRVSHVAIANLETTPPSMVLTVHGVERDRAIDCLRRSTANLPVAEDHGVFEVRTEVRTALIAFPDESTTVALAGEHPTRLELEAILASGAPLRHKPEFLDLYAQREPDAALWFVIPKESHTLANMGFGVKLQAVYGGVAATDSVTAYLHVQTETPEEAARLSQTFDQGVQSMRMWFDRVELATDMDLVTITLGATEEQLAKLAPVFGAIF